MTEAIPAKQSGAMMRTTINHVGPTERQPMPSDNTSEHVMQQVRIFTDGIPDGGTPPRYEHTLIHPQSAMEIAAWFQAPGNGFDAFASTGTVTDDLIDGIARELAQFWDDQDERARALRALDAYVRACTVTVWTVGHNTAGYLPESDVSTFLDYADAIEDYRGEVEQAPGIMLPNWEDSECDCVDGGELCDFHSMEGEVKAYLTDDVPSVVSGRVFGEPRDLGIALRPDSALLPTVYWLNRTDMAVADYVASRTA